MLRVYNKIEMKKEALINELRHNDRLLPSDILDAKKDIYTLAGTLQDIFSEYQEELNRESLFRNNFMDTVSYTYLVVFNETKDKKGAPKQKKTIYPDNFIASVLSLPSFA